MARPQVSAPSQQDLRIELLERRISKGVLSLKVRNPGNTHFRLQDITVSDGSGFSAKADDGVIELVQCGSIDMIQSVIPSIFPILKSSFRLSFSQVGLIAFTGQLTAKQTDQQLEAVA